MNVALLSSTIDARDGYGNITYELTKQFAASGLDFTLFLPESQKDIVADLDLPFLTECVLPKYVFRIYQPAGMKYFSPPDLSSFDIVHSLFAFPYCILGAKAAKKYRKPFMMGCQGTHGVRPLAFRPERWLLKRAYKSASAITVPSEYTKKRITELAKEEYPIDIIHNGVRFDRFQKDVDTQSVRDRYAGKKILLTVGGLWGRKGQDLVLRALQHVLKKHNDVVYVMVGDGNAREGLEKLASELGVRDAVDFAGHKTGDELVSYFKACDIYVHTPKVIDLKFEGFGIVYLEASACGKPIVATDAGGIRDAVLDGKTGLIADDDDVEGVAERIIQLLDDPALSDRLGKAGYAYAQKHDWTSIAKQYLDLYSRING